MLDRILHKKIDNSPLILFRILFGILISLECYGAIITGWVRRVLVTPQFTFSFIGFEWLQPLPGNGMYWYFIVMGTLGLLIAFGYRYRFAIISFTILWTGVYLMQKTAYNNHYYLLILISLIMCFLPAHTSHSLDAKKHPEIGTNAMNQYVKWIFVLQLFMVYTFASIAKLYADWLNFGFIKILMQSKADYFLIGDFLQQLWVHKIIGFTGIIFDLLVIPALLWKPTRKLAFIASIFFHLFNSVVFQIGIFPYLSLAFTVFFFEPETIRKRCFRKKPSYSTGEIHVPSYKNVLLLIGGIYFTIQLLLPLRHHFIKDNVLWTEEGHRMSWRMMLRSRAGTVRFKVVNKKTGASQFINKNDYLTRSQTRKIGAYPDFIWQFAQRIKSDNAKMGVDVAVYVISRVRINGKESKPFIDPDVDLAAEKWNHFKHHDWILPSEK
ncbi:HTTM domain-containing protein [Muriicola sp. Z0-33]|uniref:HTTM domain-containing protein n=1 Tax=Muriicola sp. Z0-33 TaxID=2816957 RepID=UPI00223812F8|nr:HTTM domain-containing protein [Muriicola sp. Z0-33]MCW5517824.1 HTTM domain-containing protein [Muriicola sp. Z0-33]